MLAAAAAWQVVAVVILAAIVAPLIRLGRPGMARRRSPAPTPDWQAVRREAQAAANLRRSTTGTLGALPTLSPRARAEATLVVEPTALAPEVVAVVEVVEPVELVEPVEPGAAPVDLAPAILDRPEPAVDLLAPGGWPAPPAPWSAPTASTWPAPAGRGQPSPRRRRRAGRWAPPVASARRPAVLTPESAAVAWDLCRHPRTVW